MSNPVVIIEDNETSADIIARHLDSIGFPHTHTSHTGAGGLQLIETVAPHLVVVDERLPDASGVELVRSIRAQYPDLTIIMCTVVDDESMVEAAFAAGCNYYALKPNGFRALCSQRTSPRTLLNTETQQVYR